MVESLEILPLKKERNAAARAEVERLDGSGDLRVRERRELSTDQS